MKCIACNTKLKKGNDYCPYCGAPITKGKFTDITIILDRSGSMGGATDKTIKAFNNYILEQRQMESKAMVSLHQFNTGYETTYKNIGLNKAIELTRENYIPGGGTALLDAIGKTISEKKQFYKQLSKSKIPEQTLLLIITDGEENSSVEYNLSTIRKIIGEQKKKGWQFAFIGAEIDAFNEAGSMGIAKGATMKINSIQDFNVGYAAASNATMKYRATGGSFMFHQKKGKEDT